MVMSREGLVEPWSDRKILPGGVWGNEIDRELERADIVLTLDDFVLFADEKERLVEWKRSIEERLERLRLRLHPRKSVIYRTSEGAPFLGYVVWPARIRIRGETVRRYRRATRVVARTPPARLRARGAAWRGHVKLAGDWRQRRRFSRRTE